MMPTREELIEVMARAITGYSYNVLRITGYSQDVLREHIPDGIFEHGIRDATLAFDALLAAFEDRADAWQKDIAVIPVNMVEEALRQHFAAPDTVKQVAKIIAINMGEVAAEAPASGDDEVRLQRQTSTSPAKYDMADDALSLMGDASTRKDEEHAEPSQRALQTSPTDAYTVITHAPKAHAKCPGASSASDGTSEVSPYKTVMGKPSYIRLTDTLEHAYSQWFNAAGTPRAAIVDEEFLFWCSVGLYDLIKERKALNAHTSNYSAMLAEMEALIDDGANPYCCIPLTNKFLAIARKHAGGGK